MANDELWMSLRSALLTNKIEMETDIAAMQNCISSVSSEIDEMELKNKKEKIND